jgi:hypothetical protein
MLLRLRDLGICEAQIMSQLPIFAMAYRENGQIGCMLTPLDRVRSGGRGVLPACLRGLRGPARACAGSKGRVYSRSRGSYLMVTCRALRQAQ